MSRNVTFNEKSHGLSPISAENTIEVNIPFNEASTEHVNIEAEGDEEKNPENQPVMRDVRANVSRSPEI